jgi:hypothetical protein
MVGIVRVNKTISLHISTIEMAARLVTDGHFQNFSAMVETLIRREYETRYPSGVVTTAHLNDDPHPAAAATPSKKRSGKYYHRNSAAA